MSSSDLTGQARTNREFWNRQADEYQAEHGEHIGQPEPRWGLWQIPESELRILGDVAGKDVLELGSGAAQWSILLARQGARMVGLDNSERQLEHARTAMAEAGVEFPLVHASAESVPLPDASFDIVFADHRLLRSGGLAAFSGGTPFEWIGWNSETDTWDDQLHRPYFDIRRWETPEGSVEFELPYGEWIRLFRRNGLEVEELREVQAPEDAVTTYRTDEENAWARRWPMEQIWKVRKL
jgi:SAM-dependent methyltransferase